MEVFRKEQVLFRLEVSATEQERSCAAEDVSARQKSACVARSGVESSGASSVSLDQCSDGRSCGDGLSFFAGADLVFLSSSPFQVHECLRRLTKGGFPRHKAVALLLQRLRGSSLRHPSHANGIPLAEVETLMRYMRLSREEALRAVAIAEEMRTLRGQGLNSLQALRVLRRRVAAMMNKGQTSFPPLERKRALMTAQGWPSLDVDVGQGVARASVSMSGSACRLKGDDEADFAGGEGIALDRSDGPAQKRLKLGDGMEVCPSVPDQKRMRPTQAKDSQGSQSPMEMSPKRRKCDA
eukprot:scaffold1741_cov262-Pinguiococcus_pyrenoidosus.AAC.27